MLLPVLVEAVLAAVENLPAPGAAVDLKRLVGTPVADFEARLNSQESASLIVEKLLVKSLGPGVGFLPSDVRTKSSRGAE